MTVVDFSRAGAQPERQRSFDEVNGLLRYRALVLCQHLLPGGERRGPEYVCAGLNGGKGRSLSVNLGTGVWSEFAGGGGGSDFISLWAAVNREEQGAAKRACEEWLGLKGVSGEGRSAERPRAAASGSIPAPLPTPDEDDASWWKEKRFHEKRWDYVDGDGRVFANVYRARHPVTGEKAIRPWDPERSQWSAPEGLRPLLYLPAILASAEPVVLVEGEKCADAIVDLGLLGTTIMGGASAIGRTDWTPLAGRDVVLWADNDPAGKDWLEKCLEALRGVGAASARVVAVPKGKPLKWDCADAPAEERRALIDATAALRPVVTGRPPLRLTDWSLERFANAAPERRWLVRDVFPAAVAGVVAASGDTGKGLLLLDLAAKVAGAPDPVFGPTAFGCTVSAFGRAVILSAEDDQGELHRRLERLDPDGGRRRALRDRLMVIPLPNAGGARPLIQSTSRGVVTTDDWERLRDQLMAIQDLALVVIDPLASFIQADLNKDSAAASFAAGQLAQLATETGATVLAAHHMRKPGREAITTSEQARDAIRGASNIVDGVRVAYALWAAEKRFAEATLKALGRDWKEWMNKVVRGAVVKSNGPADRTIRTFIRNEDSGLLVDMTIPALRVKYEYDRELMDLLVETIAKAAKDGAPLSVSGAPGIYENQERLPEPLRGIGKDRIQWMARELLSTHRIRKCLYQGSKSATRLDVPGGPFDMAMGQFATGGIEAAKEGADA